MWMNRVKIKIMMIVFWTLLSENIITRYIIMSAFCLKHGRRKKRGIKLRSKIHRKIARILCSRFSTRLWKPTMHRTRTSLSGSRRTCKDRIKWKFKQCLTKIQIFNYPHRVILLYIFATFITGNEQRTKLFY